MDNIRDMLKSRLSALKGEDPEVDLSSFSDEEFAEIGKEFIKSEIDMVKATAAGDLSVVGNDPDGDNGPGSEGGAGNNKKKKKKKQYENAMNTKSLVNLSKGLIHERQNIIQRGEEMEKELERLNKALENQGVVAKSYEESDALDSFTESIGALGDCVKAMSNEIVTIKSQIEDNGNEEIAKSLNETADIFDAIEKGMTSQATQLKDMSEKFARFEKMPQVRPAGALNKSDAMEKFGKFFDQRFGGGEPNDMQKSFNSYNPRHVGEVMLKSIQKGDIDGQWMNKFEVANFNTNILPANVQKTLLDAMPAKN